MNKNDVIELPEELHHHGRNVELTISVVYINDECFLHSAHRSIKLKLISTLGTRKKGEDYNKGIISKQSIMFCDTTTRQIFLSPKFTQIMNSER